MNFNDSYIGLRTDLLKHISLKGCSVLDVGCATGANGKWLMDSKIAQTVIGVEYDPIMAAEAKKHYTKVYNIDLNVEHCHSFRDEIRSVNSFQCCITSKSIKDHDPTR